MKTELEKNIEQIQLEIHISIKKRNGRKSFTIIEGLEKLDKPDNMNLETFLKKLSKIFKKNFMCGAFIEEEKTIILNGDHRDKVKEYLVSKKFVTEDQVKMHGF